MPTTTTLKHLLLTTVAASAVLVAACAENPGASGTTPSATEVPHPDTKAEPGNCKYFNYYHDESKASAGPGTCATDCDCDGMRSCTSGACKGDPRPSIDCDSPNHRWNEAWNPLGDGKCPDDCWCDGRRTCVWPPLKGGQRARAQSGTCEGVAR